MTSAPSLRHDFFQTATQVIVSVYLKGCQQDDVQLDVEPHALHLNIKAPSPAGSLHVTPLFGPIDVANAGVRVLATKIEVSLQKAQPGVQWPSLQGSRVASAEPSAAPPTYAQSSSDASSSAAPAPRPRSKWDSFSVDDDGEEKRGPEGDSNIDAFFKKLYADADDDTRRAMMKSYQESGGTALSTNWAEVKKARVETKPPEGMEARKWS